MTLLRPQIGGTWRSWAGNARCKPAEWVRPRTEGEVVEAVRRAADAGSTVRVAGTGHSFNSIVCTDGVLIDMSGYRGVLRIDHAERTVRVRAGTRLSELAEKLLSVDLALAAMGTLADQTIAGMVAAGNHGTGLHHQQFGGQVVGLRMVTADGTIRECAAESDLELFRAARTALGTLGVITEVTLSCVPAYRVRVVESSEPVDGLLERFSAWTDSADYVTFSVKAWSDNASTRVQTPTDAPVSADAAGRRRGNTFDEMRCGLIGQAGRVSRAAVPWLTERGFSSAGPTEFVDVSHRAHTFPQPVRFLSMEHALPLEFVPVAVREVRGVLRRFGVYSPYSLTIRVGASDDMMLSPAYGRETGYLNLTVPRTVSYLEILRIAETVFEEHEGRPHWGKSHTATALTLAPRYPEWETAAKLRAALDPTGVFSSDYIRRVLGT